MRRERKTAATAWLETWNPLRGLSIREAQAVFDASRQGDTQRLHWMFQEIEATNPVLLVCVERRASAIANFQWKVAEIAARDGALSAEQKDAAERFFNGIDNLTDALEHLDLAFFRGFSHVQPIWEADGTVREIALLDSWKFLRRGLEWLYNPRCTGFTDDAETTENARLVTVTRRRPIDYPALGLHVRHAVGSRDWGRFLERYALPKPAVVMHPGATDDQKKDYLEGAVAVENGQVSVWPNGAELTDFAGSARGTDPFGAFIEHQEKQIVLLATGGTLMSLAESGAGTLAGSAQSDVWQSIVARDSSVIASQINRALLKPYLERAFPGRPAAVQFGFDFTKPPTPKEVFEVAALARQAGYAIDLTQLEEQTGYTLKEVPGAGCLVPGADQVPGADRVPGASCRVPGAQQPFMNKEPGPAASAPADATLAAFAKDTTPAAKAIQALLQNPSKEAAEALLKDLPSLLPDDPALAAVIADAMAEEFGKTVANKTDAKGNEHADSGEGGGQFVEKGEGASGAPSDKTEKKIATDDEVKAFLADPTAKLSVEQAEALLRKGFNDTDGAGNTVHYGNLLLDHIDTNGHNENDIKARKKRLGVAIQMVRGTKPVASSNDKKPKERVYVGLVGGKAYVAVADEHDEVNAMEMVSYRRDKREDKR